MGGITAGVLGSVAGSVAGKLLGGGGGGGGSGDIAGQTGFASLPGFARQAWEDVINKGQTLAGQENLFAPSPFTDQQNAALAQVGALAQPLTQQQFQERLGVFQNPFEEQVIQNSIRDLTTANRGVLSDIGQGASAAGGFGGTRQALLESEANKNLLQAIGDVSARTRSQGFDTATQNVLSRLGQESGLAGQLFGLGTSLQQQNTATQQAPLYANQYLADLVKMVPSTSTQYQAQQGGGLSGLLGGAGGLLQGVGSLFGNSGSGGGLSSIFSSSDRRLKENIRKVGVENGHNIYEFNYKNDDKTYRGVMADEVRTIMPEAVRTHENGYDMVDYGQIGVEFREVSHESI